MRVSTQPAIEICFALLGLTLLCSGCKFFQTRSDQVLLSNTTPTSPKSRSPLLAEVRNLVETSALKSPDQVAAHIERRAKLSPFVALVYDSNNKIQHASTDLPRIIQFINDPNDLRNWVLFALTGDPATPGGNTIEIIARDEDAEKGFGFLSVSFEEGTSFAFDQDSCATCHHGLPIWSRYHTWPGAYASEENEFIDLSVEEKNLQSFRKHEEENRDKLRYASAFQRLARHRGLKSGQSAIGEGFDDLRTANAGLDKVIEAPILKDIADRLQPHLTSEEDFLRFFSAMIRDEDFEKLLLQKEPKERDTFRRVKERVRSISYAQFNHIFSEIERLLQREYNPGSENLLARNTPDKNLAPVTNITYILGKYRIDFVDWSTEFKKPAISYYTGDGTTLDHLSHMIYENFVNLSSDPFLLPTQGFATSTSQSSSTKSSLLNTFFSQGVGENWLSEPVGQRPIT